MVLDPMSALSLAGSVVQFVDFSSKIVSKGCRIYLSADGALPKNLELEVVATNLSQMAEKVRTDASNAATSSDEMRSLLAVSDDCNKIAEELLRRLEKLKVKSDARHRGWKSLRQALKSVWSKEELDELSQRLSLLRDQLQFQVLISIKENMNLEAVRRSARFDGLDREAKSMFSALLKNEAIFTSQLSNQTITITDLHLETRTLIRREAERTRTEILHALRFPGSGPMHKGQSSEIVSDSWDEHLEILDLILQSLRFPTMNDRYEAIKEAHTKTFEWIFKEAENAEQPWSNFSDWLEHGDGIYWISGKAGSGKSTLMRYIKDNSRLRELLQSWVGESDLVMGSYFFWLSGVPDQSSQLGLLRSLLFELLTSKPHLIEATFPGLWSNLRSSALPVQYSQTYSWTLARVTLGFQRLFSILSQDTGKVFLLIDGLDEYQGDPAETVELFQSVVGPNVKICASSRPWQVFEVVFEKTPKLRLQDLTKSDIAHYVNDKLLINEHMQQLFSVDPIGAPILVEEIVEKAEGVFLWVILVVRSLLHGLRNGDSIVYLRKRLKEIPSEIKALYGYMLSKVEPIYYDEGRRLFALVWLAFYREKKYKGTGISAVNLFFAIGEEHALTPSYMKWDKKKVGTIVQWVESRFKVCCAGMIEISSQMEWDFQGICLTKFGNRSVQYIHRTAKDFLTSEEDEKIPSWIRPVAADQISTRMMRANMMYLKCVSSKEGKVSMDDFLTPIIQKTMWLAYKSEHESAHDHAEILDAFQDAAKRLFEISYGWDRIVDDCILGFNEAGANNRHIRGQEIEWLDDFLCVAILWKLGRYVDRKLRDGKRIHKTGRPYLDYALRYMGDQGHPADLWDLRTISALLEHGSNPNQYYHWSQHLHAILETVNTLAGNVI